MIGGCVVWTDVVWWRGCFVKPPPATAATSCLCVCVCWMVVLQRCLLVLCAFTSPTAVVVCVLWVVGVEDMLGGVVCVG